MLITLNLFSLASLARGDLCNSGDISRDNQNAPTVGTPTFFFLGGGAYNNFSAITFDELCPFPWYFPVTLKECVIPFYIDPALMSNPCILRDESLVGVKSHESDEGKLGSQEMLNNIKHNMHAVHKIYVTIYLNKRT